MAASTGGTPMEGGIPDTSPTSIAAAESSAKSIIFTANHQNQTMFPFLSSVLGKRPATSQSNSNIKNDVVPANSSKKRRLDPPSFVEFPMIEGTWDDEPQPATSTIPDEAGDDVDIDDADIVAMLNSTLGGQQPERHSMIAEHDQTLDAGPFDGAESLVASNSESSQTSFHSLESTLGNVVGQATSTCGPRPHPHYNGPYMNLGFAEDDDMASDSDGSADSGIPAANDRHYNNAHGLFGVLQVATRSVRNDGIHQGAKSGGLRPYTLGSSPTNSAQVSLVPSNQRHVSVEGDYHDNDYNSSSEEAVRHFMEVMQQMPSSPVLGEEATSLLSGPNMDLVNLDYEEDEDNEQGPSRRPRLRRVVESSDEDDRSENDNRPEDDNQSEDEHDLPHGHSRRPRFRCVVESSDDDSRFEEEHDVVSAHSRQPRSHRMVESSDDDGQCDDGHDSDGTVIISRHQYISEFGSEDDGDDEQYGASSPPPEMAPPSEFDYKTEQHASLFVHSSENMSIGSNNDGAKDTFADTHHVNGLGYNSSTQVRQISDIMEVTEADLETLGITADTLARMQRNHALALSSHHPHHHVDPTSVVEAGGASEVLSDFAAVSCTGDLKDMDASLDNQMADSGLSGLRTAHAVESRWDTLLVLSDEERESTLPQSHYLIVRIHSATVQKMAMSMGSVVWTDEGEKWAGLVMRHKITSSQAHDLWRQVVALVRIFGGLKTCSDTYELTEYHEKHDAEVAAILGHLSHSVEDIRAMGSDDAQVQHDEVELINCANNIFTAVVPGLVLVLRLLLDSGCEDDDNENDTKVHLLAAAAITMSDVSDITLRLLEATGQLMSRATPRFGGRMEISRAELTRLTGSLARDLQLACLVSGVDLARAYREPPPAQIHDVGPQIIQVDEPRAIEGEPAATERAQGRDTEKTPVSSRKTRSSTRSQQQVSIAVDNTEGNNADCDEPTALRTPPKKKATRKRRGRAGMKADGTPVVPTNAQLEEETQRLQDEIKLRERRRAAILREKERREEQERLMEGNKTVRSRRGTTVVVEAPKRAATRNLSPFDPSPSRLAVKKLRSPRESIPREPIPAHLSPALKPAHISESAWTTDEINVLISMNRTGPFKADASARRLGRTLAQVAAKWREAQIGMRQICEDMGKRVPAWAVEV